MNEPNAQPHEFGVSARGVAVLAAERTFLALLGFFTSFTIMSQILNLSDAPFGLLFPALGIAVLAAVFTSRFAPNLRNRLSDSSLRVTPVAPNVKNFFRANTAMIIAGGALFIISLAAAVALHSRPKIFGFLPFWIATIVTALFAYTASRRIEVEALDAKSVGTVPDLDAKSTDLGFFAVFAAMLGLYFFTLVPDADDALFLNLASGVKRMPGGIMELDAMLGIPGVEVIKSTYQIESYLLLSSAISTLLDIETILAAHSLVPILSLALAASTMTLVFSTMFGRYWPVIAVFYLVVLFVLGGDFRSYGNFGLTRFFHGKAVLLTVIVPALVASTVCAIRQGGILWIIILSALAISGIGFTANGLYVAPLAIGLPALTYLIMGTKREKYRAISLAVAILYPLGLATYLLAFDPPTPSEFAEVGDIALVFRRLLGEHTLHAAFLFVVIVTALSGLLARSLGAASLYVGVLFLFVLNPALWDIYGKYVTGNLNARLMWAVPVPFFAASILGAIWISLKSSVVRALAAASVCACLALPGSLLLETSRFQWKFSPIKVPSPDYDIARAVNESVGEDETILLPRELAIWLVTLDSARPVVEARKIYSPQRSHLLSPEQLQNRKDLFEWISCRKTDSVQEDTLEKVGVALVVVPSGDCYDDVVKALERFDSYTPIPEIGGYRLYRHTTLNAPMDRT